MGLGFGLVWMRGDLRYEVYFGRIFSAFSGLVLFRGVGFCWKLEVSVFSVKGFLFAFVFFWFFCRRFLFVVCIRFSRFGFGVILGFFTKVNMDFRLFLRVIDFFKMFVLLAGIVWFFR